MRKIVELRYQRVSDAKRFVEILDNDNFKYFGARPESLEDEKKFLRQNSGKRRAGTEFNYAILYDGKVVGGCGLKINQSRNHIGEIGYFLDEKYWGKGIVTKAVKILEKIGFQKLGLARIQILMHPKNIGSEKVAKKCGYKKEGTMKSYVRDRAGKLVDMYLYAKIYHQQHKKR